MEDKIRLLIEDHDSDLMRDVTFVQSVKNIVNGTEYPSQLNKSVEDQPSIPDILANALQVICETHGVAVIDLSVRWIMSHEHGHQWPIMNLNDLTFEGRPCQKL